MYVCMYYKIKMHVNESFPLPYIPEYVLQSMKNSDAKLLGETSQQRPGAAPDGDL